MVTPMPRFEPTLTPYGETTMHILAADRDLLFGQDRFLLSAEASTLGLKPGQWPTAIQTDIGNQRPFVIRGSTKEGGDLRYVDYLQPHSEFVLRIFND
jgi:hypothetical protein